MIPDLPLTHAQKWKCTWILDWSLTEAANSIKHDVQTIFNFDLLRENVHWPGPQVNRNKELS